MPLRLLNPRKAFETEPSAYEQERTPRGVPRASLYPLQPVPEAFRGTPWFEEKGYCARCVKRFVIPPERKEKKAFCPQCGQELRRRPREAIARARSYAKELELSPEARQLQATRIGYRCEGYLGSGATNAIAILEHEVISQGNENMVNEAEAALNLPLTKWPAREHWFKSVGGPNLKQALEKINQALKTRFGPSPRGVWLATLRGVRANYCEGGETPLRHKIPKDALIIADLGEEGQLFVMSEKDYAEMEWHLLTPEGKKWARTHTLKISPESRKSMVDAALAGSMAKR